MFEYVDRQQFTFAFIDCKGYGSKKSESGPYTVEQIAADIISAATLLLWDEFHVLGHSMAAMSVQRLMADFPKRILSGIMLAPVPASGACIDEDRRRLLLRAIEDGDARQQLIDANTGDRQSQSWLRRLRDLSMSGTRPEVLSAYMDSWTGTDFSREVDGCVVPALAIVGTLDPGAPATRIRETMGKWFSRLTLVVMPDAGHYPMQEVPGPLMRVLSEYLLE